MGKAAQMKSVRNENALTVVRKGSMSLSSLRLTSLNDGDIHDCLQRETFSRSSEVPHLMHRITLEDYQKEKDQVSDDEKPDEKP